MEVLKEKICNCWEWHTW